MKNDQQEEIEIYNLQDLNQSMLNNNFQKVHELNVSTSAMNLTSQQQTLEHFIDKYFHLGDIQLTLKLYEKYTDNQIENIKNQLKDLNVTVKEYYLTEDVKDFNKKQFIFKGQQFNEVSPQIQFQLLTQSIYQIFQKEAKNIGISIIPNKQNNSIKLEKNNQEVTQGEDTNLYNKIQDMISHCGILIYKSASENERDLKFEYLTMDNIFNDTQQKRRCEKHCENNLFFVYVVLHNIQQNQLGQYQSQLIQFLEKIQFCEEIYNIKLKSYQNNYCYLDLVKQFEKKNRNLSITATKTQKQLQFIFKFFNQLELSSLDKSIIQKFQSKIAGLICQQNEFIHYQYQKQIQQRNNEKLSTEQVLNLEENEEFGTTKNNLLLSPVRNNFNKTHRKLYQNLEKYKS